MPFASVKEQTVSDAVAGAQVNFINHFSGCQLCTQQNKEGDYAECESEFVKSFEFADAAFGKALKRAPPRNISLDAQLAATPYCQVCWGDGAPSPALTLSAGCPLAHLVYR